MKKCSLPHLRVSLLRNTLTRSRSSSARSSALVSAVSRCKVHVTFRCTKLGIGDHPVSFHCHHADDQALDLAVVWEVDLLGVVVRRYLPKSLEQEELREPFFELVTEIDSLQYHGRYAVVEELWEVAHPTQQVATSLSIEVILSKSLSIGLTETFIDKRRDPRFVETWRDV